MTESGSFALFLVSLITGAYFAYFAATTYSWALIYKDDGFKDLYRPMMIATSGLYSLSFSVFSYASYLMLNNILIPLFAISLKNLEIIAASFLIAAIFLILLAKIFTKKAINETGNSKNILRQYRK